MVADNRYIAEDAAALVDVDYEVLPAVERLPRRRSTAGAPRAHMRSRLQRRLHVPHRPMATSTPPSPPRTHVFEEEIWQHRGGGMAMETPRRARAITMRRATCSRSGRRTQTPHIGRRMLADLLDRDLESIRVIAPDVGGGFGPKAMFYPEEAVIPAAALKLGRPVKWIEDRREHFLCATQERDQYWNVAIAVDAQGKILGVRGAMLHDTGAFVPWGIIMPYIAAATVPGPYVIPHYALDVTRRAHQQGGDHAGARRRPAAGGVRHGAADGPRRARAEARSAPRCAGAISSSPSRCPTRSG